MEQPRKPKGTSTGGQFDVTSGSGSGDLPDLDDTSPTTLTDLEDCLYEVAEEVKGDGGDPLDYDLDGIVSECYDDMSQEYMREYARTVDDDMFRDSVKSHDMGKVLYNPARRDGRDLSYNGSPESLVAEEMRAAGQDPGDYDLEGIAEQAYRIEDDGRYYGDLDTDDDYADLKRRHSWRHILGHAMQVDGHNPSNGVFSPLGGDQIELGRESPYDSYTVCYQDRPTAPETLKTADGRNAVTLNDGLADVTLTPDQLFKAESRAGTDALARADFKW